MRRNDQVGSWCVIVVNHADALHPEAVHHDRLAHQRSNRRNSAIDPDDQHVQLRAGLERLQPGSYPFVPEERMHDGRAADGVVPCGFEFEELSVIGDDVHGASRCTGYFGQNRPSHGR